MLEKQNNIPSRESLKKRKGVLQLFDKYAGKGKGVWPKDGQQLVNELREE